MLKELSERLIEALMIQKEDLSEILLQVYQSKYFYDFVQCTYSSGQSHDSACILPQKGLPFGHGIRPYDLGKIRVHILLHETRNHSEMVASALMKFIGNLAHRTLYRTSGNDTVSTQRSRPDKITGDFIVLRVYIETCRTIYGHLTFHALRYLVKRKTKGSR